MNNFTLHNPTKIHFGTGQISRLSAELRKTPNVLFLFGGGSIKRNGIYDEVKNQLKQNQVIEFIDVKANPKYEHLMEAVNICKNHDIDMILAVGGGSVIDAAKFVAAGAKCDFDPWLLYTKEQDLTGCLPMGCVLTLPATGSESNGGSVISRGKDKLSLVDDKLRPQFAILDPEFTMSLPVNQIANGVIDAFAHVVEQYVTQEPDTKRPIQNKVQDRFSEGLLMTLIEDGLTVKNHPQDIAARTNIMWAANQALNGLIGAGVQHDWSTHLIGHELTALYGLDHARTLSIILPAVWKVRKAEKSQKLIQYAERVWSVTEGTVDERLEAAIHKTEQFFVEMGLPIRLPDVGLGEECIEPVMQQLQKHKMTAMGEDGSINLSVVGEILRTALD